MKKITKSSGFIAAWVSCIVNLILFALKYLVGMKIGSIAMKADAWHTLSDTFTSIIVIISFWIALKKADKDHPFGHGRAELIGTVIIGVLLAVVGFNFFKESIHRLGEHKAVIFSTFSIIVFAVTIIIKEAMAIYSITIGKKINSRALIADGWHHRSDAITTLIIVIGALIGKYFWWIDSIMGILISLYIIYITYDILKGAFSAIIGERSDPVIEKQLKELIRRTHPLVVKFHHLHIHKYGDHIELTFHICLPAKLSLKKSHDIITLLEKNIKTEMNMESTIHIEPC